MNFYGINWYIFNKILVDNVLLCFICEIRESWGRGNGEGKEVSSDPCFAYYSFIYINIMYIFDCLCHTFCLSSKI